MKNIMSNFACIIGFTALAVGIAGSTGGSLWTIILCGGFGAIIGSVMTA